MRGLAAGLLILLLLTLTVLSLRPGGLRRQLRFAARRFRIVLVLGGVYVFGSLVIRLLFTSGPIADDGPIALALVLAVVFVFVGRDPAPGRG
ncbi:MAG TPA: hypothetical protein VLK30_12730 [Candidatus Limnocylindrales bacterium]|nr:hypothetical protein [Candidatus Limnocylindrales bacterium]